MFSRNIPQSPLLGALLLHVPQQRLVLMQHLSRLGRLPRDGLVLDARDRVQLVQRRRARRHRGAHRGRVLGELAHVHHDRLRMDRGDLDKDGGWVQ